MSDNLKTVVTSNQIGGLSAVLSATNSTLATKQVQLSAVPNGGISLDTSGNIAVSAPIPVPSAGGVILSAASGRGISIGSGGESVMISAYNQAVAIPGYSGDDIQDTHADIVNSYGGYVFPLLDTRNFTHFVDEGSGVRIAMLEPEPGSSPKYTISAALDTDTMGFAGSGLISCALGASHGLGIASGVGGPNYVSAIVDNSTVRIKNGAIAGAYSCGPGLTSVVSSADTYSYTELGVKVDSKTILIDSGGTLYATGGAMVASNGYGSASIDINVESYTSPEPSIHVSGGDMTTDLTVRRGSFNVSNFYGTDGINSSAGIRCDLGEGEFSEYRVISGPGGHGVLDFQHRKGGLLLNASAGTAELYAKHYSGRSGDTPSVKLGMDPWTSGGPVASLFALGSSSVDSSYIYTGQVIIGGGDSVAITGGAQITGDGKSFTNVDTGSVSITAGGYTLRIDSNGITAISGTVSSSFFQ